eukprot:scaffold23090_cov65-Phaeocystis_antarctica.AAC.7
MAVDGRALSRPVELSAACASVDLRATGELSADVLFTDSRPNSPPVETGSRSTALPYSFCCIRSAAALHAVLVALGARAGSSCRPYPSAAVGTLVVVQAACLSTCCWLVTGVLICGCSLTAPVEMGVAVST